MHPWVTHPVCHGAFLNPQGPEKWKRPPGFSPVTIQWLNQTTYPLQIYDSGEDDFYSRANWVKTSSSFRDIPFFAIYNLWKMRTQNQLRTIHHPAQKRCQGKGEKANPLSFFQGCGNLLLSSSRNGAVETKPFLPSIVLVGSWMGSLCHTDFYNPPIIGWYHPLYKLHNLVAAQPWSHWKSWLLLLQWYILMKWHNLPQENWWISSLPGIRICGLSCNKSF